MLTWHSPQQRNDIPPDNLKFKQVSKIGHHILIDLVRSVASAHAPKILHELTAPGDEGLMDSVGAKSDDDLDRLVSVGKPRMLW
jgi:hypothetical protein